jgi:hypothetical protein
MKVARLSRVSAVLALKAQPKMHARFPDRVVNMDVSIVRKKRPF